MNHMNASLIETYKEEGWEVRANQFEQLIKSSERGLS